MKKCKECQKAQMQSESIQATECNWWELWCKAKVALANRKAKKEEM